MKSYQRPLLSLLRLAMLLIAAGCSSDNARLEKALEAAGSNRTELQAVIDHYADSPEKQAAARWLIANMPGHYGYEGSLLDSVETTLALIQDIMPTSPLPDSDVEKWKHYNLFALPRRIDLTSISAKLLIHNVDQAYDQWKGRAWNRNLSFEDFCEYILPYRLGDERLTDWRPKFDSIFASRLDSLYNGDDVLEAVKAVMSIADSLGPRAYCDELSTPYRDPLSMLPTRVGNCRDECALIAAAMRACGIPVAMDHMLPAPDSGVGHTWLVVRDNKTNQWLPFGYDDMPLTRDSIMTDGRVKGKVYRYTFAPQHAPSELHSDLNIPSTHSRVLDVTANYFGHNSVEVDCEGKGSPLLASWTKKTPIVIGTGKRKGNRAVFTDVEPGVILFPAIAERGRAVITGYPFVVDENGAVNVLRPDIARTDIVRITRKTPLVWRKRYWLDDRIRGLIIEASTDRNFTNSDTIMTITSPLDSVITYSYPNLTYPARYIRILPSDTEEITFAEIILLANEDGSDTLKMNFETSVPNYIQPEKLTDGSRLTFVEWLNATPLIARLDKPSAIRRVELVARNDDNFIVEGREYELFWHDGPNGWQSAGRTIATGREVTFDVPKGAVCIVRCLTTGVEEQPFVWRNGRQMFSLDLSKARYK